MSFYLWTLTGILSSTILGLFFVITKISPSEFTVLGPVLFYSLFFLATSSLFTLLGYFLRRISNPNINKFFIFPLSFRQGLLLGIFASISAAFLQFDIFSWGLEIIVMAALFFVEFFFIIKSK